ncbi:MAG: pyruvate dehydrogenase E2 component (dihydrolipoamide acetyltransferase) [Alphaproteobacteria bacterium]|jgi:pyruvate dehydrogenase E2 component (dihydrolipoamide acetyltransferase)
MPVKILMPALSPTMTEGNLAQWHKKEGDRIEPGDVLAEIETDKATMEVEAVDEGTLGKIIVGDGTENVQVNQIIGYILEDGEDASAIDAMASQSPAAAAAPVEAAPVPATVTPSDNDDIVITPLARRIAEQAGLNIAEIAGTGARGKITRADVEATFGGDDDFGIKGQATVQKGARVFASPLARRMAGEAGLDLANVTGTGPNGRIVKADIDKAKLSPRAAPVAVGTPSADIPASEAYEIVKMSTMRKVIAGRMAHSKSNVPHFYATVDCEIDELLKVRKALNERGEKSGVKLSVNDFIIRACALALMEVPEANAGFESEGQMRLYSRADISIAVAIKGGLITPIIRGANEKGLAQISGEMKDLATRAKDSKLAPEEYQGGSFSISNLGMFGIKQFDAVINEPQGCILAVGAGEPRPVVKNGEIVPATVMSCTLSCDHRVVDGATGALLLSAIKRLIEYPPAMLL